MADTEHKTILAVDCGTSTTRAVLIDNPNDVYRLAGQATAPSTPTDITQGIAAAIERLQKRVNRPLLDQNNEPLVSQMPNGHGVQALVVTLSAARPLKVALAGLMDSVSLRVAREAASTIYADLVSRFSLDDEAGPRPFEARMAALQQQSADLILLVGGIDGGAEAPVLDMARMISLTLRTMPAPVRPHIVFAGNTRLRARLAEIFGGIADFKPVNNIFPALGQTDFSGIQPELDILYMQRSMSRLPGFDVLSTWGSSGIVPTAKSFVQTIHYLGRSYGVNVLGVDIGSAATTLAAARSAAHRHIIRADVGAGASMAALLGQTDVDAFRRWLPVEMDATDLRNKLYNRALVARHTPPADDDRYLHLAVVREAMRAVAAQAKQAWHTDDGHRGDWFDWDLIVGSGQSLTGQPASLAALALLDGFEPAGICSLTLDNHGLVRLLGGVALAEPLAAAQLAAFEALRPLGTVVAPVGVGRPGETALKFKMTYQDGRRIDMKIAFGVLEVIPLAANEKASLEVRPSRNFSLHPSGRYPGRGMAAQVQGGELGVIIDTRGRPITLPRDDAARRKLLQNWLIQLDADAEPEPPAVTD